MTNSQVRLVERALRTLADFYWLSAIDYWLSGGASGESGLASPISRQTYPGPPLTSNGKHLSQIGAKE
jgi:hypothetical protein